MRGFAFNIRTQAAALPSLSDPDVLFFEEAFSGETVTQAETRLRANPSTVTRTLAQIKNIVVTSNTGGGGGGGGGSNDVIAVGYNPGTSIPPETGVNFLNIAWSSGTVKLN